MAESAPKLSLKLFVDVKQKKVIFAEAEKPAVDFLFHLLTLPLGTTIRLISKEKMSNLGNLFDSIQNLDQTFIKPGETKYTFLKPYIPIASAAVSNAPLFSLPELRTAPKRDQYSCSSSGTFNNCSGYVSYDPNAKCPSCSWKMSKKVTFVSSGDGKLGRGGFIEGLTRYMVMDDLVVKPMSAVAFVEVCNKLSISDAGNLEEKHADLGSDEALSLLEASLVSRSDNVLTTVFLKKILPDVKPSCEGASSKRTRSSKN